MDDNELTEEQGEQKNLNILYNFSVRLKHTEMTLSFSNIKKKLFKKCHETNQA